MTPFKITLACLFATLLFSSLVAAQTEPQEPSLLDPVVTETLELIEVLSPEEQQAKLRAEAIVQLDEIQQSLTDKLAQRKMLKRVIAKEGDNVAMELLEQLEIVNQDIESLGSTFEQIASDGAQIYAEGENEKPFDWREELITIVKPLIENVKGLTEKPRKVESLRRSIEDKQERAKETQNALDSVKLLTDESPPKNVSSKLKQLQERWENRLEELERAQNLAEFQLNNLEGRGVPWTQSVKEGLDQFIRGRGFTLLLAAGIAVLIWSVMWTMLWLIRKRTQGSQERSVKTGYRLAAWAYKLLTGLLIAIGIMSVFYFRQDLLLLAIMMVIFVGAALALRNLLPRYMNEGRLLLNMGSVRERERVMHNGVPWRVDSINVQTFLSNPEIRGVVRLPLNSLHDMVSRPVGKTEWFPSSRGDWVLGSDGSPLEVLEQSVEIVELRSRNGIMEYVPSADYFAAGYQNLSRNGSFRVRVTFGVDYNLQHIALTEISKAFSESIKEKIKKRGFAEDLMDVSVEFDSAGESSLDYFIAVRFKASAAQFYRPIQRLIQQACVATCNERAWGIPFPQLTVHRPSD